MQMRSFDEKTHFNTIYSILEKNIIIINMQTKRLIILNDIVISTTPTSQTTGSDRDRDVTPIRPAKLWQFLTARFLHGSV